MVSAITKIKPGRAIEKIAASLERDGAVKPPIWALTVKSGVSRERVPSTTGFWFKRAAAVLRTFYFSEGSPLGVQRLRNKYGGRKRHLVRAAHHRKGGGGVLRRVVQQLEEAGFVEKQSKTSGRVITAKGKKFVNAALK